nr:hypothetical protein [Picobirnavirus sp.]
MTTNQLAYLNYVEQARSNLAKEEETKRANMAKEWENQRSNLAREAENTRSNQANELQRQKELQQAQYEYSDQAWLRGLQGAKLATGGVRDLAGAYGDIMKNTSSLGLTSILGG